MTARFLVGDTRDRLREVEDESVDFLLTSPPFLALRSYLPDGHPDKAKEIGSEATPAAYIDVLLQLTAEWERVLAPHGSIAVELGDTYAGSGGAGGDYGDEGWRTGQLTYKQKQQVAPSEGRGPRLQDRRHNAVTGNKNRDKRPGWPLDKSLTCIPQLYQVALAYGINPLTGQPSPAGRWRVRNLKPWIRSNPPVGALGDKERPATSYVIVACRAQDRWFDLDAVRTTPVTNLPPARGNNTKGSDDKSFRFAERVNDNGGAPPRDWWHHVDAIIDAALAERVGKPNGGSGERNGKEAASGRGGGWSTFGRDQDDRNVTTGAQGVHLRRALERAGILTTLEALDVSPRGYSGAHYAVWPPELCRLLIDEMCPRRVCLTCGEPSRRITVDRSAFARQPELAAHIKERREALGITSAEVNGWFGYKEIAKNWERTDKHGAAIPNPSDWPILADRLGLDRERFDDLVLGDRRWTESTIEYDDRAVRGFNGDRAQGRGGHQGMPRADRYSPQTWSDCGHGTWRSGHVLDPFAGSGTTLSVATGMGRTATGIDIDERNAHLALERVGMFLDIDHGARIP